MGRPTRNSKTSGRGFESCRFCQFSKLEEGRRALFLCPKIEFADILPTSFSESGWRRLGLFRRRISERIIESEGRCFLEAWSDAAEW